MHRSTLWKILRSCGVPLKMIDLIEMFYDQFECSVILDDSLPGWFPVDTGVRQGCVLSPILFSVVINWIMRQTTLDKPRGLKCFSFRRSRLRWWPCNALSQGTTICRIKQTDWVDRASRPGSISAPPKHKWCTITPIRPITVDGEPLEFVEDFTYLWYPN